MTSLARRIAAFFARPIVGRLTIGLVAAAWVTRVAVANTTGAWSWARFGDYRFQGRAPVDALARGDLAGLIHANSMMGPVSVVIRAPLLDLAHLIGGGEGLGYTLGSLACSIPLAALAAWLLIEAGRFGRRLESRIAVAGLLILCPFIAAALRWGHAEDLLATALCIAAVLLAVRGRTVAAALSLLLAIATKQWALVAIAPMLLALPRDRMRVAASVTAVVGGATLAVAAVDPRSFLAGIKSIASADSWVSATNVWWPVSHAHVSTVFDGVATTHVYKYSLPAALNWFPHALIVLIGIPLGAAVFARRRPVGLDQVLSLLALLLFLRCALDPWDNAYYQVAPLIALYARDALCARGLPLASAFATVATVVTFNHVAIGEGGLGRYAFNHGAGLTNAAYLAYMVPLIVWLTANALQLRGPRLLTTSLPALRVSRRGAAETAQAA